MAMSVCPMAIAAPLRGGTVATLRFAMTLGRPMRGGHLAAGDALIGLREYGRLSAGAA